MAKLRTMSVHLQGDLGDEGKGPTSVGDKGGICPLFKAPRNGGEGEFERSRKKTDETLKPAYRYSFSHYQKPPESMHRCGLWGYSRKTGPYARKNGETEVMRNGKVTLSLAGTEHFQSTLYISIDEATQGPKGERGFQSRTRGRGFQKTIMYFPTSLSGAKNRRRNKERKIVTQ